MATPPMLMSTLPLAWALVEMLILPARSSIFCWRVSTSSLAVAPPAWARTICWFRVAMSLKSWLLEATSLWIEEFNPLRTWLRLAETVLNWLVTCWALCTTV